MRVKRKDVFPVPTNGWHLMILGFEHSGNLLPKRGNSQEPFPPEVPGIKYGILTDDGGGNSGLVHFGILDETQRPGDSGALSVAANSVPPMYQHLEVPSTLSATLHAPGLTQPAAVAAPPPPDPHDHQCQTIVVSNGTEQMDEEVSESLHDGPSVVGEKKRKKKKKKKVKTEMTTEARTIAAYLNGKKGTVRRAHRKLNKDQLRPAPQSQSRGWW